MFCFSGWYCVFIFYDVKSLLCFMSFIFFDLLFYYLNINHKCIFQLLSCCVSQKLQFTKFLHNHYKNNAESTIVLFKAHNRAGNLGWIGGTEDGLGEQRSDITNE